MVRELIYPYELTEATKNTTVHTELNQMVSSLLYILFFSHPVTIKENEYFTMSVLIIQLLLKVVVLTGSSSMIAYRCSFESSP